MASSALAPPQVVDVTLSLFGGRKTDIAPSDCPEGITPDEQDGVYLPGDWQSRPCLSRLYASGQLSAGSQVLYEKTYVQPNNQPLTLILTSDGKLWVENIAAAPPPTAISNINVSLQESGVFGLISVASIAGINVGDTVQVSGNAYAALNNSWEVSSLSALEVVVYLPPTLTLGNYAGGTLTDISQLSSIFQVTPGLYAQSVSADGREYIAFSDLLHGQAVPLQYDGTNLDRVTQDGPGQSPTVADVLDSYPLSFVGTTGPLNQTAALSESANVATAGPFTDPHGLLPGSSVLVQSVTTGYVGIQVVTGVPSPTTFTYTVTATGLGAATGHFTLALGLVEPTSIPSPLPQIGDVIVIAGSGGGFDNSAASNPPGWSVVATGTVGGVYQITFSIADGNPLGSYTNETAGTVTIGGQSSPGVHQVVCMFLTRNGALTPPSPPISFVSVGNSKWTATNLPIGPANVVARVLGFTGAGGDNFFIIPASVSLPNPISPLGTPIVVQSTIVPDNVSTSYTFDVPDNTLSAAIAIDQIGNDLFDQRVLGPVLGFFSYASRLACWGDYQKVENLLNMGFCGGYLSGVLTTPLGWTNYYALGDSGAASTGGLLVNGGAWAAGMVWQITGDGSLNRKGCIAQSAYQDAYGDPIVLPNTSYVARFWAANPSAAASGQLTFQLFSPSTGFSALATANVNELSTSGSFVERAFPRATPDVIPSDLLLVVYDYETANGQIVLHGELELVYAQNPYNNTLVHVSYALNPEGFAQTTGDLGAADDTSAVQCLALLHEVALLETSDGVHTFQDNDYEPYQWVVNSRTRALGALGLRAGDPGKFGTGDAAEDWAVIASYNGAYLFAGGEFWKISQEVSRGALSQAQDPRPTWDDITRAAAQTVVAKNDPATRRCYFALPLNGAAQPNYVFVLDYREMDTATQISSAPPVHITIQGKMKSSDLTRKWSVWNVSANDIEILVRPNNVRNLFFAGGARNGVSYGNIYSLNPAFLTDDDYGQIYPYYTTYAFTDHDQEQALGLGSDLHLVKHIHAFIPGVGLVYITPIVDSLYNFQPSLTPRLLTSDLNTGTFLKSDLEWTTVGIRGHRIFFRISVQPLPGATDVQLRVQKFIVGMMKDPVAQFRQSGV